jgi:radical SAM protein with 4Fe4S-binding SPASM domain
MQIAEKYFELGKKCFPTRATWEITPRCNARCAYCYLSKKRDFPENNDTTTALQIIDKLSDSGILFLVLTGGEPFIRKDILSILEYIIRKDFFSITIYSNGTLITDQHLRFLTTHRDHIQSMQFSVFSHVPEINDAYLGVPGGLDKILKNGTILSEAGIPVILAFNLFDFNVRDCETTKRYFNEKGFLVRMSFSKLTNDASHEKQLEPEMSKQFYTSYLKSIDQGMTKKMQRRIKENDMPTPLSSGFCVGLYTNIAIDYKGNISPCVSFRNFVVGSVFSEQSIREVLLSSSMFNQLRSLKKSDLKSCEHCNFINKCRFCLGMMHTRNHDATMPLPQYCTFLETLESYECNQ